MVRLRGLPYSAKEQDIIEFFQPLVSSRVIMDFDQFGRPSGEAEVYFQSHDDAQAAMKKNNQHIGELCTRVCALLLVHEIDCNVHACCTCGCDISGYPHSSQN